MDKQELVMKDFRNFMTMLWRHLNLPKPTPVQDEIADFLQKKSRRRIIMGFRGVGKSWITAAWVLYRLKQDPQLKFLVVSASKDRANDFATFVHTLIEEIPLLQELRPRGNQRYSRSSFDVGPSRPAQAPSVKAVGIFGQLTGGRADEIVADDVEVPNTSLTPMIRDRLENAVGEFEGVLKPGGIITFLGTAQTEETLYIKLEGKGHEIRMWPSQVPELDKIDSYRGCLSPSIEARARKGEAGQATDPLRFSVEELLERRVSWGRTAYTLQFLLDTSLSDADTYPLKLNDLVVMSLNAVKAPINVTWASGRDQVEEDLPAWGFTGDRFHKPLWTDPLWGNYEGSVMAVDPSGRGQDETGYAVVKQLHGFLYVLAAGGLKGGYDDHTLTTLAKIAKRHQVNEVVIEDNFGGGMYLQMLAPVLRKSHGCSVTGVWHNTQKERRIIDTLEPVMSGHRLIVDPQVIRQDLKRGTVGLDGESENESMGYSLFYQMTRITKEKGSLRQDDRLDALAMAVNYWTEFLGRDAEEDVNIWHGNRIQDELDNFKGVTLGRPQCQVKDLRWM